MFTVSDNWREAYPGAFVGVLVMGGVTNPKKHEGLDRVKEELEEDLRTLFTDKSELRSQPVITAYKNYYKRFKKTYHVLQQVESVVFKGKSIPRVAALVEAMFAAELRNMLLTAGHDMAAVKPPVTLNVAESGQRYVRMNGQEQELKAGDMIISDTQAVMSSVIYGPDARTRITPHIERALFTTYAPPGISEQQVQQHLDGLEANVKVVAPDATVELKEVYGA